MKVTNTTVYDTATLRKITSLCLKEFKRREKGNRHVMSSYNVTFKTHRGQGWVGGYAYYHNRYVTIKLPLNYSRPKLTFVQSIADVIFHELGHCIGVKHRTVHGNAYDTIETSYREWVLQTFTPDWELPLEVKTKPKVDMQLVRYQRVLTNLERAKTRYNRAKTLLAKWQTKGAYYERALAKAGKLPPTK